MSSKQQRIVGTQRTDNPDIEEICLAFEDVDADWSEAGKRREQKRLEVDAMLKVRGLKFYKYWSQRKQRYIIAKRVDQDPKLKFEETDEGDGQVGLGLPDPETPPAGMEGLIAEAEKAQAEVNVTESEDGDIDVPDKAAPKSKGRKSKPKKAKRK